MFSSFRRGPQLGVLEDIETLIGECFHGPCPRLSKHRPDSWPHVRHQLREYLESSLRGAQPKGAAEGRTSLVWSGLSGTDFVCAHLHSACAAECSASANALTAQDGE